MLDFKSKYDNLTGENKILFQQLINEIEHFMDTRYVRNKTEFTFLLVVHRFEQSVRDLVREHYKSQGRIIVEYYTTGTELLEWVFLKK